MDRLLAPLDGNNRFCGIDAEVKDFPRLYITDLSFGKPSDIFKSAVCVKACPKKADKFEFKPTGTVPDSTSDVAQYDTTSLLNYCFPSNTNSLPDNFKQGWQLAK
jgi:hypothetical protein